MLVVDVFRVPESKYSEKNIRVKEVNRVGQNLTDIATNSFSAARPQSLMKGHTTN